MPRGVYPRNKPVSKLPNVAPSKIVDATDDLIEGRDREFNLEKLVVAGPPPIDTAAPDVLDHTNIEHEKFMAQMLDVYLHDPVGEHENSHAFIGVNGEQMWLKRGAQYQLKRCHVAVLANAKSGRVIQDKGHDADGAERYINREVLSLMYPFSVIADPHPRGPAWLRETMKRAS